MRHASTPLPSGKAADLSEPRCLLRSSRGLSGLREVLLQEVRVEAVHAAEKVRVLPNDKREHGESERRGAQVRQVVVGGWRASCGLSVDLWRTRLSP